MYIVFMLSCFFLRSKVVVPQYSLEKVESQGLPKTIYAEIKLPNIVSWSSDDFYGSSSSLTASVFKTRNELHKSVTRWL